MIGRWQAIEMCQQAGEGRVHVFDVENHVGTPVYVHAKVCVVDDVWASVGSDNFNRRSWTHDSELSSGVLDTTRDPREPRDPGGIGDGARVFARDLRLALAREHLDLAADGSEDADLLDPARFVAAITGARQRPRRLARGRPAGTAPARPAATAPGRAAAAGSPGCGRRRSTAAGRPRRPAAAVAAEGRVLSGRQSPQTMSTRADPTIGSVPQPDELLGLGLGAEVDDDAVAVGVDAGRLGALVAQGAEEAAVAEAPAGRGAPPPCASAPPRSSPARR